MALGATALASWALGAGNPENGSGAPERPAPVGPDGDGQAGEAGCPESPTAYVLEGGAADAPGAATALLRRAGLRVAALSLDRSPFDLGGLIFLGTRASARVEYQRYMKRFASELYGFVDRGNVLVQMPQAAAAEPTPPFLPTTHLARREKAALPRVQVLVPDSPLLRGLTVAAGALDWPAARAADPFASQGGFEVSLAADGEASRPLLMEGAYGQGRLILSALAFDLADGDGRSAAQAARFAANLRAHVVSVCRRRTQALRLTPASAAPRPVPGAWTLAVLPDTQVYSLLYPGVFTAQTAWIATHARELDIRHVVHLGDIVNNNTAAEWRRAADAMSLLDGVVPYALVPGNHDYGPSGDASSRDTLLNEHFPYARASRQPTFGGAFQPGRLDNTFHLFAAGGRQFVLLALEWAPRDPVIAWANQVMRAHPTRLGILVTHAYLHHDSRRDDWRDLTRPQPFNPHQYRTPGGQNDGEELWQKLVRRHPFVMVLNGHALGDGTGYLVSPTDRGTLCHQMLSNYQMRPLGGSGYLRLIQFHPDGTTVRVHSYSPLYDRYLWDPDQAFTFTLDAHIAAAPPPRL